MCLCMLISINSATTVPRFLYFVSFLSWKWDFPTFGIISTTDISIIHSRYQFLWNRVLISIFSLIFMAKFRYIEPILFLYHQRKIGTVCIIVMHLIMFIRQKCESSFHSVYNYKEYWIAEIWENYTSGFIIYNKSLESPIIHFHNFKT